MAYSCTLRKNLGWISLCIVVFITRNDANVTMENEDRFKSLEDQFKKSFEGLELRLNEKIDNVTETLDRYEPKMGGIAKDIKQTISNTVAEMVKAQCVAITKSINQEKKVLIQVKNDTETHMKQMKSEIANAQMRLEERFENQTALLNDEFYVMKDVIQNDSARLNYSFNQEIGIFDARFDNYTKELDARYSAKETGLDKTIALFQIEALNNSINFESKFIDMVEILVSNDLKLESRLTNHDSIHSTLSSIVRSYKSSADSVDYRVGRIETKLRKHSSFYAEKQNSENDLPYGIRMRYGEIYRNEGSEYSSNTGHYTAPEDGVYLFWFSLQARNGKNAKLCLWVDGRSTGIEAAEKDGGGAGQVAFTYLSAGSKVSVHACLSEGGSSIAHARTAFSGVLLYTK